MACDVDTGATVGVVDMEPSAAHELTERGGAACKGPADSDRPGLPPGHLLLLTHHGALPQGVCLQGCPGNSLCTSCPPPALFLLSLPLDSSIKKDCQRGALASVGNDSNLSLWLTDHNGSQFCDI